MYKFSKDPSTKEGEKNTLEKRRRGPSSRLSSIDFSLWDERIRRTDG
jgi:hypothetical protein